MPTEIENSFEPKIFSAADKAAITDHYEHASKTRVIQTSYATARDYCEYADWLPQLMSAQGGLKDVQGPWIVKSILTTVPSGGRLVEVGRSDPIVAAALAELGYQVTFVAPYDNPDYGQTEYEHYVKQYPQLSIIRDRFSPQLPFPPESLDAIYSVSVLENVSEPEITTIFTAIQKFLRPGGCSLHCVASVIEGNSAEQHHQQSKFILKEQARLAGQPPDEDEYDRLLKRMRGDLETFYLPVSVHHSWRSGKTYNDFPFRKIISFQTYVNLQHPDPTAVPPQASPKPHYLEESLDLTLREILPIMQDRLLHQSTYWGVQAIKNPNDFWVYQEIIHAMKPDVIIEIGTHRGGSTLALAHICDLLEKGRVIALDISHANVAEVARQHPRIIWIEGDACESYSQVRQLVQPEERVLVIEDSSHTYENTLHVLRTYSELIKPGDYFIVEDSNCHHGLSEGPYPGPYEAIEAFLAENPDFVSDRDKESFLITWNPKGFLKRVK